MQYLITFLEGLQTFISPCILPILPVYFSIFAAGEENKKKTVTCSTGFVVGFTFIFVLLGAFAGALGGFLNKYTTQLNIITGFIIILLGLNFMGAIEIRFLKGFDTKRTKFKNMDFLSSMLLGIIFAIGWTPCTGAFLGTALGLAASSGTALKGLLLLLLFSLGLGIPFIISAIIIDRLKGAFDFIKRNYKIINIISGALLVIIGFLMATGLINSYLLLFNN